MKKPNLFIVGEPRSGTTALHEFLSQHPDIFMSTIKEPMYFCKDFTRESIKHSGKRYSLITNDKDYLNLYNDADEEKILGESSTRYLFSKVAAKEIYKFNKDAKIIMILREPVDFLKSYHDKLVSDMDEPVEDFEEALSLEKKRVKGRNLPKHIKYPSSLYYSKRAEFSKHIKRFMKYFTKDQIKIIIFDDFRNDNNRVYYDVLRFLGVKRFTPNFELVNAEYKTRFKSIRRALEHPRLIRWAQKMIPKVLYKEIRKFVFSIVTKRTQHKQLDEQLRNKLKKKYKKEVESLSKITGRNLMKLWGY